MIFQRSLLHYSWTISDSLYTRKFWKLNEGLESFSIFFFQYTLNIFGLNEKKIKFCYIDIVIRKDMCSDLNYMSRCLSAGCLGWDLRLHYVSSLEFSFSLFVIRIAVGVRECVFSLSVSVLCVCACVCVCVYVCVCVRSLPFCTIMQELPPSSPKHINAHVCV